MTSLTTSCRSAWSTPRWCATTTATSSKRSARGGSRASSRPDPSGSAQNDRIPLDRNILGFQRLLCRALGDRAVKVELAAVARAVDRPVGHLVDRATGVRAGCGEAIEHPGRRLRNDDLVDDDARSDRNL